MNTETTWWQRDDAAEMRYRLRMAVEAAHAGKPASCGYYLSCALEDARRAGLEQHAEELEAARAECNTALRGAQ